MNLTITILCIITFLYICVVIFLLYNYQQLRNQIQQQNHSQSPPIIVDISTIMGEEERINLPVALLV